MGGFNECDNWISLAKENEIKWWATSALEGNVGLNAIAQWVYTKNSKLRQGLGTIDQRIKWKYKNLLILLQFPFFDLANNQKRFYSAFCNPIPIASAIAPPNVKPISILWKF